MGEDDTGIDAVLKFVGKEPVTGVREDAILGVTPMGEVCRVIHTIPASMFGGGALACVTTQPEIVASGSPE